MTHAGSNVDFLARSLDRFVETHVAQFFRRAVVRTSLLGVLSCGALALALVPARDSIGPANVGLVMALVIAIVGSLAGLTPGLVTAASASMFFAVLHSVPHGLPATEERQDALTAGLLLAMGLTSGLVHRRLVATLRRDEMLGDEIKRLHRIAEVAVRTRDPARVTDAVIVEVTSELRLAEAFLERGPPSRPWRVLAHNGRIEGVSARDHDERLSQILADGMAIDIGGDSRLVLVGDPNADIEPGQLRVVVALADYAMIVAGLER